MPRQKTGKKAGAFQPGGRAAKIAGKKGGSKSGKKK